jgi:hypothetical protein
VVHFGGVLRIAVVGPGAKKYDQVTYRAEEWLSPLGRVSYDGEKDVLCATVGDFGGE